jgi:hypothetical protein
VIGIALPSTFNPTDPLVASGVWLARFVTRPEYNRARSVETVTAETFARTRHDVTLHEVASASSTGVNVTATAPPAKLCVALLAPGYRRIASSAPKAEDPDPDFVTDLHTASAENDDNAGPTAISVPSFIDRISGSPGPSHE